MIVTVAADELGASTTSNMLQSILKPIALARFNIA